MKTQYNPYTGPAGPTLEQANQNTLSFKIALEKQGIECKVQDISERFDTDSGMIELKITRADQTIYVGYDRWGFIAEPLPESDIDQWDFDETLQAICDWNECGSFSKSN